MEETWPLCAFHCSKLFTTLRRMTLYQIMILESCKRLPVISGLLDLALTNDRAKHRKYTLENSISTNPYFFWGPFAGPVVSNAAHTFIRMATIIILNIFALINTSRSDVQSFSRIPQRHPG